MIRVWYSTVSLWFSSTVTCRYPFHVRRLVPITYLILSKLTSALPFDTNIYGLGEVVASSGFRRDLLNGTLQTMWNRDAPNPLDENMSVFL